MNWLRKLMVGRYGLDQLSMALLIAYLPISLFAQILRVNWLNLIALAPLAICYFRIFSRNIVKRREENRKFLVWWYPFKSWFNRNFSRIKDIKDHRYFQCPSCKQKVRVPKGKGNIRITCPKCRTQFVKRT
ncbi:hypothetical protein [Desulfitobacterium sp. AusDCA]|uniref:hypothetical protein n=1 Tax=Desulfitobacterium sp. AusDCA TaxID=3240383 RepID=UPI003DA762A3